MGLACMMQGPKQLEYGCRGATDPLFFRKSGSSRPELGGNPENLEIGGDLA